MLALYSNQLKSLDFGVLNHLSLMTWFDSSNNSFVELKADWFQQCTSLGKLDMLNNKIKKIERELFDVLPALFCLDLRENICASKNYNSRENLIRKDATSENCFNFEDKNRFRI